ncbi:hypothetical protein [Baileyella intestinalis]|uniref:hypothetical protein n=1 Tax=Baileyella intestinalis TaxID=2606709 RepID=UPI003A8B200D
MFGLLLDTFASLGIAEAQSVLSSAGERLLKKYKDTSGWKKLIVGTGEFYIKNEQGETSFLDDLKLVLSRDNLSKIASELKDEDGYDLKQKLYEAFMDLMRKYEIPYENAELYTMRLTCAVLEQVRITYPQKFEQYYVQEWREEQEQSFLKLQNRIDKISNELEIYNREQVAIASSGMLDVDLRKSTNSPSIGIEFFTVDDE